MAQPRYILLAEFDFGAVTTDPLKLAVVVPRGTKGVPYVGSLAASGGTPPYVYAISAGTQPGGLSLNTSTGAITGTPTTLGYSEFTAAATDQNGIGTTVSKVVSITIVSGIVISGALAPAEAGIPYSSGLAAVGGTLPYVWTVASGTLPTGLSISSSTGLITGTTAVVGAANLTIRATDAGGDHQDFPVTITVAAAVALSGTFHAGLVGTVYSAAPALTGGVGPYTFSYTGTIPVGCSFSSASGTVFGTPSTAATYAFTISVLDALGGAASTAAQSVVVSASAGGSSASVPEIRKIAMLRAY